MKKVFTKTNFLLCTLAAFTGTASAQNEKSKSMECEAAPSSAITSNHLSPSSNQVPWSILYNYNLLSAVGSNGNAGICFVNNQFWVSRWANDTIYLLSSSGVLLQTLKITGVTGTRSLTTDGTFIYAGVNTNSVKKSTL